MKVLKHLILFFGLTLLTNSVTADSLTFRIGTGGSEGTYYPIGTLLSRAITGANIQQPSENNKNIVAVAQRSNGSVANVSDIEEGLLEGALSQADIAHWAYHATGPFSNDQPKTSLRTVASLYSESFHLIARADSNIHSIHDLKGRNVSIDEIGSGTLYDVELILSAFGIQLDDINPVYLKLKDSINRLRNNEVDALILVAGAPVQQIVDLVNEGIASVISLEGQDINGLDQKHPFLSLDAMPAGTYGNDADILSFSVPAQLLVSASLDDDLVYEISKALWSEQSKNLLYSGHPKGRDISIANAIAGVSIPLHPGAKRFYEEQSIDTSNIPEGSVN